MRFGLRCDCVKARKFALLFSLAFLCDLCVKDFRLCAVSPKKKRPGFLPGASFKSSEPLVHTLAAALSPLTATLNLDL